MFHGSIVALITPFGEDHGIDIDALSGLVSFHVEAGTSALVVAGTTGESATLEEGEFERLVSEAVRCADGEIPIIAGTGSASTAHTIKQSILAESLGATAVLVVTPYYNRPTQFGLKAHYQAVADAVSLPVILYNVPSRTSVDLLPETAIELSRYPGIAGIKEAVPDSARVERLVRECPPDLWY
jgi:4-hydroxy-tetrahydrodipicolinate synthase